jgi:hypothetical protein
MGQEGRSCRGDELRQCLVGAFSVEERKTLLTIEDVEDEDFFVALAVLSWPTGSQTCTRRLLWKVPLA